MSNFIQRRKLLVCLVVIAFVIAAIWTLNAAETKRVATGMYCRGWPFAHYRGYRFLATPMIANVVIGIVFVASAGITTHQIIERIAQWTQRGVRFHLHSILLLTTYVAIFIALLQHGEGILAAIPPRQSWPVSPLLVLPIAYSILSFIIVGVRTLTFVYSWARRNKR